MRKILAALTFALAAAIVSPAGPAEPAEAAPRFRLAILKAGWHELGRAQDWESAWPRLKEAAGGVLFSVDERDVAAYDWQAQRIVLHPEAGRRLLAAAQELPGMSERLYKLRALWATNDLREIVDKRGFMVSLDDRPIYGGIFLAKHSNLSMRYPVIHVAVGDDRRVVLRFSPIQFSFGSLWDNGTGDALETDVHPAIAELREVFPDALERMARRTVRRSRCSNASSSVRGSRSSSRLAERRRVLLHRNGNRVAAKPPLHRNGGALPQRSSYAATRFRCGIARASPQRGFYAAT